MLAPIRDSRGGRSGSAFHTLHSRRLSPPGDVPEHPDIEPEDRARLYLAASLGRVVHTGVDGATPAMRLGFADRPLAYADLLWPGEKIPRTKRSRRKGRAIKL